MTGGKGSAIANTAVGVSDAITMDYINNKKRTQKKRCLFCQRKKVLSNLTSLNKYEILQMSKGLRLLCGAGTLLWPNPTVRKLREKDPFYFGAFCEFQQCKIGQPC